MCILYSNLWFYYSQTVMLLEIKKVNPNILLPEYGISPFHLVIGSEDRKFAYLATKECLLNGADPNVRFV